MAATTRPPAASRLRRLARGSERAERPQPTGERCELCGAPLPGEHRHLVDLGSRALMCACRACTLLFDHRAAGGGHYRLVPDRRVRVIDLELGDTLWERLRIPVEMAFFFRSTPVGRTVAFYPGPAGATESTLDLAAWREVEDANPVLAGLESDVEALLVNRAGGARDHWIVPIDDCYELVGNMRAHWSGLSGGRAVWGEIGRFFERLDERAKAVTREGEAAKLSRPATKAGDDREEGR
jgi:hypothetical protein